MTVPDPPEFSVARLPPRTWFERRADAIARDAEQTASKRAAAEMAAATREPKAAGVTPTPLPARKPEPPLHEPTEIAPWEAQLLSVPSVGRSSSAPATAAARWPSHTPRRPEPDAGAGAPRAGAVAVSAKVQSWGWTGEWGIDTGEHAAARARRDRRRGTGQSGARPRRLWAPIGLLVAGACVVVGVTGLPRLSPAPAVPRHSVASVPAHQVDVSSLGIVAVPAPSPFAMRSVPHEYLKLYIKIGNEYGLNWTMLAAVGQIESHSGSSRLPGVNSGTNSAGAAGPAQFETPTWERFGVDADGRGQASPYDPVDAITAMAAYLKASGAPQNWNQALLTYNHSQQYANSVTSLATRFNATGTPPA